MSVFKTTSIPNSGWARTRCQACFLCAAHCPICHEEETNQEQSPTTTANAETKANLSGGGHEHFSFCPKPECDRTGLSQIYFCSESCHSIHRVRKTRSESNSRPTQASEECDDGPMEPQRSSDPNQAHDAAKCRGFRVDENAKVGRFVVASRDIQPLEWVLEDAPLIIAPQSQPVCLVCLRKPENLSCCCTQCGYPMCSQECASLHRDWPECDIFRQSPSECPQSEEDLDQPSVAYSSVGVIRFLDSISDPKQESLLSRPNFNRAHQTDWLLRLMDHIADFKAEPAHHQYLSKVVHFLSTHFPPQSVERAYGILRVNSFGYTTPKGGEGRALYPMVALLSHSCQPNVQHIQKGSDGRVKLVAQRPIKVGEEITIGYINTFQGPLERQFCLRDQWFFDCRCSRCLDASECGLFSHAVRCAQCSALVLPQNHLDLESPWICQGCQTTTTPAEVEELLKSVKDEWEGSNVDRADTDAVETFIKEVEQTRLSEFHHFLIKLKSHLVVLYSVRENDETRLNRSILERRVQVCQTVMKYMYHIDPGQTKKMGVFLLELNKPRLRLAKVKFDEGQISRKRYLQMVVEGTQIEAQAKNMIGTYTLSNAFAIKSSVCQLGK